MAHHVDAAPSDMSVRLPLEAFAHDCEIEGIWAGVEANFLR